MRVFVILLVVSATILFGCSPRRDSVLVGTYEADYEMAKEKLTLKKDGTFIQEITRRGNSEAEILNGTWSYNPTSGYITFSEQFVVVYPSWAKPRPDLVVDYPVETYFGLVYIGVSKGVMYKKIND